MKNRISNLFIIIIFIAMITVPQIACWFAGGNTDTLSHAERRALYSKPEFKFADLENYPKKFDNYYNDHLPFRTNIIEAYAYVNFCLFGTIQNKEIVHGKEDWLFFKCENNYPEKNPIEQAQGITEYTDTEKSKTVNVVHDNYTKLKEKGIDMYILVLPNKASIYKEYLPDSIKIKSDRDSTKELLDYVGEHVDVPIIYPKEEFLAAKEKHQIYLKYDTHWNKIGACIGAIELAKGIDPSFSYDVDSLEIEVKDSPDERDLSQVASLTSTLQEKSIFVNNFYSDITYEVKRDEKGKIEEYTSNSENDKTIMIVGDSYRNNMKEYFARLYKKVIVVDKEYYRENLLEEYKPDILVQESVERKVQTLNQTLVK